MTRLAAGVEYFGAPYSGWQEQDHAPTLQAKLQAALARVADRPVALTAAGRTDAGVHALQQVVHFDTDAQRAPYAWLLGANSNLPPDVSLRWVQPVSPDFHARYSAVARRYRYVIHNSRARSALLAERAAWWTYALNAEAMHEAVQVLVGEHDFSAFRAAECQSSSPMRNVHWIRVRRSGDFVVLDVQANAFLHHMVRNIAGVLLAIGQGKRPPGWCLEVLESRDRVQGGMTAPACGLYFVGPEYPPQYKVPVPPDPWFP